MWADLVISTPFITGFIPQPNWVHVPNTHVPHSLTTQSRYPLTFDGHSPQVFITISPLASSAIPPTTRLSPLQHTDALHHLPVTHLHSGGTFSSPTFPMSSTLASQSVHHFLTRPHLQIPSSEDLRESSFPNHNSEGKEEHSWQHLFRNGLPTPPTSKAMTGLTLKNHCSNGVHPPAQSLPKYPHQDASSGGNKTGERNRVDREQEQLGYNNHSQRHRPSTSRDFGFDTKMSTGNVIASNFRIPESINSSGGSIAEFAAEVGLLAGLFWSTL